MEGNNHTLSFKGIKILPLKGNHENDVRNGADLWKEFLSGYVPVDDDIMNYTYVYKDMLLVCLDNYNGEEKVDISWLEDELKRNRDKKVLVFGHEPAFKVFMKTALMMMCRTVMISGKYLNDII